MTTATKEKPAKQLELDLQEIIHHFNYEENPKQTTCGENAYGTDGTRIEGVYCQTVWKHVTCPACLLIIQKRMHATGVGPYENEVNHTFVSDILKDMDRGDLTKPGKGCMTRLVNHLGKEDAGKILKVCSALADEERFKQLAWSAKKVGRQTADAAIDEMKECKAAARVQDELLVLGLPPLPDTDEFRRTEELNKLEQFRDKPEHHTIFEKETKWPAEKQEEIKFKKNSDGPNEEETPEALLDKLMEGQRKAWKKDHKLISLSTDYPIRMVIYRDEENITLALSDSRAPRVIKETIVIPKEKTGEGSVLTTG